MPRRLARFLALPAAERTVLLQALLWLPATAAALRWRGLRPPGVAPAAGRAAPAVAPARITDLVAVAARHGLVRGNCLSRSLTLRRLLRRAGIEAQLRIGVRRGPGGLEAHAWLELEGRPLNDSADVALRYAPFPDLAAALPRLV